ncbi:MAG: hypothetical protein JSW72_03950, partial [Candidatus Bathyarchaeota archaeon]
MPATMTFAIRLHEGEFHKKQPTKNLQYTQAFWSFRTVKATIIIPVNNEENRIYDSLSQLTLSYL